MQTYLLPFLIKAALLLSVAMLILHCQRDAAAAHRHRHLAAAFMAMLFLPLFEMLPEINLAILPHQSTPLPVLPTAMPSLLLELYCFGLLAGLLIIAARHVHLITIIQRAQAVNNEQSKQLLARHGLPGVKLVQSCELSGPVSYGLLRAAIVVPDGFFDAEPAIIDAAINHEIAHLKRRDCWLQLIADLVLACNWCNPLAWYCIKRLRDQAEFCSDDDVVVLGGDQHNYANALVHYTRTLKQQQTQDCQAACAWLDANLSARIQALLQVRKRERSDNARLVETALLYIFLMLPFSVVNAVPAPNPFADFIDNTEADSTGFTDYELSAGSDRNSTTFACGGPTSSSRYVPQPAAYKAPPLKTILETLPTTLPLGSFKPGTLTPQLAKTLSPRVSLQGDMPVRSVMPRYPRQAVKRRIEGYVIVAFDIDENGRVSKPYVAAAQPANIFDKAALEAIRQSRFKPLRLANKRVGLRDARTRYLFQINNNTVPAIEKQPYPFAGPTLIAISL